MLKPGNTAPEFILPDETGKEVSLTQLLEDNALVLFFYPADESPLCTRQVCAIRDIHDDLASVGLTVVGVSPQDGASHRRFKEAHKLPFRLICDVDKIAIRMYDADGPLGIGVRRVTYLINQGQKIQDAITADLRPDRHREFLEKAVMLRETAGLKVTAAAED